MSYDWRNYISVLTPTVTSGNLQFEVETYDAAQNITLTFNVSALGSWDEIKLAKSISDQMNTILLQASAAYSQNPYPVFANYPPNATFYVSKTDHIVSFWSQAQYRLQLVSNNTGASIRISSAPTFVTLAKAKSMAPLIGIDFSDFNEEDLSDNQIMELLEMSSNQIVNIINNPLVIANYLLEKRGTMTGSIRLKSKPVLDFDAPYVIRPNVILPLALPILLTGWTYEIVRDKGLFTYRYSSDLIQAWDPFEINNEVKMTYRAGQLNIPKIVMEKVLEISGLALNNTNIKSLKGGSASVEFRLPQDTYKSISQELGQFRIT